MALSGRGFAVETTTGDQGSREQAEGKPDPHELLGQNGYTSLREEGSDAQRRDLDRSEGREVASGIERAQEGDPETSVGEGIEHTVRGRGQKQIEPRPKTREAASRPRESQHGDDAGGHERERYGVPQAPVAERVLVRNIECESDNVEIGGGGTQHTEHPQAWGSPGSIERWDECECRGRMSE